MSIWGHFLRACSPVIMSQRSLSSQSTCMNKRRVLSSRKTPTIFCGFFCSGFFHLKEVAPTTSSSSVAGSSSLHAVLKGTLDRIIISNENPFSMPTNLIDELCENFPSCLLYWKLCRFYLEIQFWLSLSVLPVHLRMNWNSLHSIQVKF